MSPTSSVHRMVLSASLGKSLRMLRKWEVSLKYDFVWESMGLGKMSTNAEIFSAGQPLAETMG